MAERTISLTTPGAGDAPVLSTLAREAFSQTYGPYNSEADLAAHLEKTYSSQVIEANLQAAGCQYVLARVDGHAAGFGLLAFGSHCSVITADNPAEIKHLYVLEAFQRLRLGWRLMDRLKQAAVDAGSDVLWLGVWQEAHWARRFYERYGMSEAGTMTFMLGSDRQTDIVMSLPLPPPG